MILLLQQKLWTFYDSLNLKHYEIGQKWTKSVLLLQTVQLKKYDRPLLRALRGDRMHGW